MVDEASYMHPNNPSNGTVSLVILHFIGSKSRCSSTLNRQRTTRWRRATLTALLGSNSVDRVVRVTLSSDSTADGNGGGLTLDGLSIGVNIGNLDLDRGVILGGDQSV